MEQFSYEEFLGKHVFPEVSMCQYRKITLLHKILKGVSISISLISCPAYLQTKPWVFAVKNSVLSKFGLEISRDGIQGYTIAGSLCTG